MVKKHFIFDLDGTLAESKTPVSESMRRTLNKLPNVYVISGASKEQMESQLKGVKCKILAQNGNQTDKWINYLRDAHRKRILRHINLLKKKYGYMGEWEHRGCQISYSFTGHNAPAHIKKAFDPDKKIRQHILEIYPFNEPELIAQVAGNTCIDYNTRNGTKGKNLMEYTRNMNMDECIYFGDNLQEGGNDHSVVGVMDTVAVKNPDDLLEKLQEYV